MKKVVLQLELLRQLSQISGVEFAQRQQQTGQRLLRQGSQCGAVIAGSVHRGSSFSQRIRERTFFL